MAYHDNVPLKFDTCLSANLKRGSKSDFCLADDFFAYFDQIRFHGDIDAECSIIFVPPA